MRNTSIISATIPRTDRAVRGSSTIDIERCGLESLDRPLWEIPIRWPITLHWAVTSLATDAACRTPRRAGMASRSSLEINRIRGSSRATALGANSGPRSLAHGVVSSGIQMEDRTWVTPPVHPRVRSRLPTRTGPDGAQRTLVIPMCVISIMKNPGPSCCQYDRRCRAVRSGRKTVPDLLDCRDRRLGGRVPWRRSGSASTRRE